LYETFGSDMLNRLNTIIKIAESHKKTTKYTCIFTITRIAKYYGPTPYKIIWTLSHWL